jgi:hypothetical protein
VLDELVRTAAHVTEQYANNRIETDHARLKARLRPMRGHQRFRSAGVIAHRTRLRTEPPPRTLPTCHRRLTAAPPGESVQRTRPGHVNSTSAPADVCHVTLAAARRLQADGSGGLLRRLSATLMSVALLLIRR